MSMDLGEMNHHFDDIVELARFLLDPDNTSSGFVAFRQYLQEFPFEDREKLYDLAFEIATDTDMLWSITVLVFGLEPILWAAYGLKSRDGMQDHDV